jgi:hypothetical protein
MKVEEHKTRTRENEKRTSRIFISSHQPYPNYKRYIAPSCRRSHLTSLHRSACSWKATLAYCLHCVVVVVVLTSIIYDVCCFFLFCHFTHRGSSRLLPCRAGHWFPGRESLGWNWPHVFNATLCEYEMRCGEMPIFRLMFWFTLWCFGVVGWLW